MKNQMIFYIGPEITKSNNFWSNHDSMKDPKQINTVKTPELL